jgi:hypothetical protein
MYFLPWVCPAGMPDMIVVCDGLGCHRRNLLLGAALEAAGERKEKLSSLFERVRQGKCSVNQSINGVPFA